MATTSSSADDGKRRVAARLVVAVLGVAAAWFSLAVTIDNVPGARASTVAVRWGLNGAAASARRAGQLAQPGGGAAALAQAEHLAKRALSREPVSVSAVRALGQLAALHDDLPRADRLFSYAERLSRRDLLTQMWLIEERVRHDDVPGALLHYNRALKTVRRARPILFPIMISAAADPDVAAAITRLLSERTAWGPDFIGVMAQNPNASPVALGRLLPAAQLRLGVAAEREALDAGLARLVASSEYGAAYKAYRQAVGATGRASLVQDGGFEEAPLLAPFDWTFADEAEISATREASDGGRVLVLRTVSERSGEFARQLLILTPDRYRLGVTSSGASTDPINRAAITVACVQGGNMLVRLPLSAVDSTRLAATFSVPSSCAAQTLTIAAPAGLGAATGGVSVDDLTIEPIRG